MKTFIICCFILFFSSLRAQEKPNFLWLVCEDQSLFFAPYGDSNAYTPNINQLAVDGVVFENCFTTSPVCAPSRSSLITGMYPTTIGSQNMRAYKANKKGNNPHNNLPFYSPVPNQKVQFFTEILRANNYYCTNNSKEDYNMECSPLAWDESSQNAHWRKREDNQPFFSVFNFSRSHEANVWKKKIEHSSKDIKAFNLPSIFPKNDLIKRDFLTNYKNIEKLDEQIGIIINQLKEDGLYENTIIFFFSDHGGPFPGYKRSINDLGIQCPFIVKWNEPILDNRNSQMVSFVDFAPTVLAAANLKPDYTMEGISFYKNNQRDYIFAGTDRFDELKTQTRCIRNKKYKLILNLDTNFCSGGTIKYRNQMATMKLLNNLKDENELNTYFKKWFDSSKELYELYNLELDCFETKNLVHDTLYDSVLFTLKKALHKWIESSDYGLVDEQYMVSNMLNPDLNQPELNKPSIQKNNGGIVIKSNNRLASVGWRYIGTKKWNIYTKNSLIPIDDAIEVLLFRVGYKPLISQFK